MAAKTMFVMVFPKGRTETTKSTWIRPSPYSFRSLSKKSPPTNLAAPYMHINGFGDERKAKTFQFDVQIKENPSRLAQRGSSCYLSLIGLHRLYEK